MGLSEDGGVSALMMAIDENNCIRGKGSSAPVYKYYSTSEINCYSKGILETNTKVIVLNDQPAYVHLVSAYQDYGKDIEKWERFGSSCGEKVIDPSVTGQVMNTYDLDTTSLADGDFYTVIVWFADGTSDISSVWKK